MNWTLTIMIGLAAVFLVLACRAYIKSRKLLTEIKDAQSQTIERHKRSIEMNEESTRRLTEIKDVQIRTTELNKKAIEMNELSGKFLKEVNEYYQNTLEDTNFPVVKLSEGAER